MRKILKLNDWTRVCLNESKFKISYVRLPHHLLSETSNELTRIECVSATSTAKSFNVSEISISPNIHLTKQV
nr:MAG TPA: hypothetical protein [Ackermannviridae sp.]